jgi:6-phospho-beta-glucosidase
MKIAVIGGGSTYTPELMNGFIARGADMPLAEVCLMDIDAARLEVVGGFARRMVEAKGARFAVTLSTDLRAAVAGAACVVTQLRVGGMHARIGDEYLGRRHGIIGQETTGVGGMAKALRTIPVILAVAEEMRRNAPGALLVNFTNPSGLVTEALARHAPGVRSVGLCNVGISALMGLLPVLEAVTGGSVEPARASLRTLGLNHLDWHRGLLLDGTETWPRVFSEWLRRLRAEKEPQWDPTMVEALGMIPNGYLEYYYHTDRKLAAQEKWPPSRGEQVLDIEAGLLRQYADPGLVEPPADLMKRGGAYYSTLATELIESFVNDRGRVMVANARQAGAVPGWPAEWVLEMPCVVDRAGVHPVPSEPLPPACARLVERVKEYELLTVQAAVRGDQGAAEKALAVHPLGPGPERARAVLDDMLKTNAAHLPGFGGAGAGGA